MEHRTGRVLRPVLRAAAAPTGRNLAGSNGALTLKGEVSKGSVKLERDSKRTVWRLVSALSGPILVS